MNNNKKLVVMCLFLFLFAVLYTLMVMNVDVKGISADGSNVGFSTINIFFRDLIGKNMMWYKITKYLGLIPILMAGCYGLLGLGQLIKKKSIAKVDKKLIALGCFYVLFVIVYVLFEKFAINYRPFLIDGELEASYPSTHTLLAVCICGSSLLVSKYFIKKDIRKVFDICTWILMIVIIVGRILSGVHWLTDIFGGIMISLFMLMVLYTVICYIEDKKGSK